MNRFFVTRTGTGAPFGAIILDPLNPDPDTKATMTPANARSKRESFNVEAQLIDAAHWLAETEDNVVSVCLDCGLTVGKEPKATPGDAPGA